MKKIGIRAEYIICLLLLFLCFLLYWKNMGNYPFLDTDETRFVSIAKEMLSNSDWINVRLNGENSFSYPPFLFWLINFSCFIFEKISAEIVRIPISFAATFGIILLFSILRNLLSKSYAFIITIIFATSLGTLVFSRLATTDILFTIFTASSILCASKTLFSRKNKQKIIVWALAYMFIAFATMTCGPLGLLIPATCIFTMYAFSGNLKELYKAKHIIPGLLIFLLITLPWHIIMISKHGIVFANEYLRTCNFTRYAGLRETLSVITIFLIGFIPWAFSLVWVICSKAKDILASIKAYFKDNSQIKLQDKWQKLRTTERFLYINTVVFFTALVFAILYGSKHTFSILFLIFPASCITGFYWYEYIVKKEHDRSIFFATIIPNIILIICSILGLFGHNFINTLIMQRLNNLIVPLVIIFFVIPVFGIFSVLLKGRIAAFISNIILMISISFIITPTFFNFMIANGGEKDLINFAHIASKDHVKLTAFIPSKKHSITYYYDNKVNFKYNDDINWLKDFLKNNPHDYVIVEIKDLWTIEEKKIPYLLIDSGKRYCLIQHMPSAMIETKQDKEPEIFVY